MAKRIDSDLGALARNLRGNPGEPERRLWNRLRASQTGLKFRRQAVIDPFIVDFLCPFNGLIVELDGDEHDAERDRNRDTHLTENGYTVVRFGNADVMTNVDGVVDHILSIAAVMPERRKITHPTPSLGREGL
ncbi:endonuclease domain-containing protein [Sphingobium subterraneum]|uniref:endonuclease domain-containing protein n=1 Tax=Sphingobium subterraneum TaxID=627688 RepID=UPI0016174AD7|nr:endonuclease domain-containing protein [Sphingobium subterraneum]